MAPTSDSAFRRVDRINSLMDIYGNLLTEKQRRFVELHYGEDLSFGEIAAQFKVSRQAIYDAVKHALGNLDKFENTLRLLEMKPAEDEVASAEDAAKATQPSPQKTVPDVDVSPIVNELHAIRRKVQKQRIIYNVDWLMSDLARVISQIEKLSGISAEETGRNSE